MLVGLVLDTQKYVQYTTDWKRRPHIDPNPNTMYIAKRRAKWRRNRSRELFVVNQANRIQMQTLSYWQTLTRSVRFSFLFLYHLRECARSRPHLVVRPQHRSHLVDFVCTNQVCKTEKNSLAIATNWTPVHGNVGAQSARASEWIHIRCVCRLAVRHFIVLMNF